MLHECAAVRVQRGVGGELLGGYTVREGVALQAHVKVAVPEPCHGLPDGGHRAQHNLRVEVVWQVCYKLRLDRRRRGEHAEVVRELVVGGHDVGLAEGVELGAARPAEDLLHVEHPEVREAALGAVVHLHAWRPCMSHQTRGRGRGAAVRGSSLAPESCRRTAALRHAKAASPGTRSNRGSDVASCVRSLRRTQRIAWCTV